MKRTPAFSPPSDTNLSQSPSRATVEPTPELIEQIMVRIAHGVPWAKIARQPTNPPLPPPFDHFPSQPVMVGWCLDDSTLCGAAYARAIQIWAESEAQMCNSIADAAADNPTSASVQAAKLRIDTRHWNAQLLLRHRYAPLLDPAKIGAANVTIQLVNYAPPAVIEGAPTRGAPSGRLEGADRAILDAPGVNNGSPDINSDPQVPDSVDERGE